jgi:hypothetical protein
MTRKQTRLVLVSGFLMLGALALVTIHFPESALARPVGANSRISRQYGPHHPKIKSFSVTKPDDTLTYPSTLVNIPDEHTTFIPLFSPHEFDEDRDSFSDTYLVFAASKIKGGNGGTVVLETTDLKNFDFASNLGYSDQVMVPPVLFTTCDSAFKTEFDENYSAPGTVLQNPVGPPGNYFMFYEAENHCPGGVWQQPYYATVGFASSRDYGMTWPGPINSEFGGPDRHPVIKGPNPEPASEPNPQAMGDALPSAFADRNDKHENYIYVTYDYAVGPGNGKSDGLIRVARARIDDDRDHHRDGDDRRLTFWKWNNGAFNQPGIGGQDSGPVPSVTACPGRQTMASISYNDDLGSYLFFFVCNSATEDGYASWFYSTATSLDLQDWTPPQLIENSRFKILKPCPTTGDGAQFDGFYPSFMSPGAAAGHTRLTGKVFFMNGCDTGLPRAFASRTFTITVEP